MKLSMALLALPALAAAKKTVPANREVPLSGRTIKADSKMGGHLLANARKLENADENMDEYEWVVNYEIKFQGCHHIQQWNEEANGEDEPKIQTKRLVRFRLCPAGSCTSDNAGGCDSGMGDYIVDLNIFLEAYWQDKQEQEEWNCEYAENNVCYQCDGADNEEYCMYDCYNDNGYGYCNENNPYAQDEEEVEELEPEEFLYCAEWDIPDNNNRKLKRKLEDEVAYFIGPYCSDQGGSVHLGVFTDEFCTIFADDEDNGVSHTEFYYAMTGQSLPYSNEDKSMVDMSCLSCKDRGDVPNYQEDNGEEEQQDEEEEEEPIELCAELYAQSGKCESNMSPDSYYFKPNENACNYMDGIKIMRTDGTVVVRSAGTNKTAAAFIGIFATSFVLLGAYVFYLKTKLDRSKVDLSGQ